MTGAVYQGGIKQYGSEAVDSSMDGDRKRPAVDAAPSNPQLMNKPLLRNRQANSGVRSSRRVSSDPHGGAEALWDIGNRESRRGAIFDGRPFFEAPDFRRETETAPVRLGARMAGISTCK
jgi:hypothetical protein